jgi:hypothetical protein
VSRHDPERLNDILTSIRAIERYLKRGDLDDGLIFDAVRMRLIEIGEAVKDVDDLTLAMEPAIPRKASLACETDSPTGTSIPRTQSFKSLSTTRCHYLRLQSDDS